MFFGEYRFIPLRIAAVACRIYAGNIPKIRNMIVIFRNILYVCRNY